MRPLLIAPLALLLAVACGGEQAGHTERSEEPEPAVGQPAEEPAEDPVAGDDGLECHPVSRCLCWEECALLRVGPEVAVRLDSEGEEHFAARTEGHEACDADGRCAPGFDSVTAECEETCAPSRAPFFCRRDPSEPIDATGTPCARVDGEAP